MQVKVLGALQVLVDGSPVRLGTKERVVMARLVLGRGAEVSDDSLVATIWGDRPPASAKATLQGYVHRIRQKAGAGVIERRHGGYAIDSALMDLDVATVEHDAVQARRAMGENQFDDAADRFRKALTRFRGSAYLDLGDDDAVIGERARLDELRRALAEELVEAELACGRHQDVVGELEALVASDPTRERTWSQLMVALARSGRQADALDAFSRAKRALALELGIEPGARLRQLEQAVLQQDDEVAPRRGSVRVAPVSDARPTASGALPEGTVTFVFTDVEGSTHMLQELQERWPGVLEAQHAAIRAVALEWNGVELGTDGDAVKLAFVTAADAVRAASAIQQRLAGMEWPDGHELRVRIGIHSGDVQVHDGHHVGLAPHITARVSATGHGGQVLITEATRALAGDVATVDLGPHHLRDLPSPVRLHQLVIPGLPQTFPPLRGTESPTNLPTEVDSFVGRAEELAEIASALEDHRLVTLTGPGGSGKTRLALRSASRTLQRHPDGVWLTELVPLSDDDQVSVALAKTLGVVEQPERSTTDALVQWLRQRDVLVVLDNCEHVLGGVIELVERVLPSCASVRILATSRELLGVRGEYVMHVRPLSLPDGDTDVMASDAVRLFVERARAVAGPLPMDAPTTALVISACRSLDGLPLALEIAAAHLRSLSLPDVVKRLKDRFRLEATGQRDLDDRQRTLAALVSWSYDLLAGEERAVFRRLSVLPDVFGLDAAEALAAGPPVTPGSELGILQRLVDKSLVMTVRGQQASLRYRMLETLRQYAGALLDSADEADDANDRFLAWSLDVVARVEADIRTPRQDAAMAAAELDRLNLRAAFDWAMGRGRRLDALRLASAVPLGRDSEREQVLLALLDELPRAPAAVRARAWATLANLAVDRGDADATISYATQCLAEAEADEDPVQQAWANYFLTHGHWTAGRLSEVKRLVAECLVRFQALGLVHGSAYMKWIGSLTTDDLAEAERLGAEAERAFRELGMPSGLAHALEGRALVALRTGDLSRVRRWLGEAIELVSSAGNVGCTAHCLDAVAAYAAELGWLTDAVEIATAAERFRGVTGHRQRVWESEGGRRALEALARHGVTVDPSPDAEQHTVLSAATTALALLARPTTNP